MSKIHPAPKPQSEIVPLLSVIVPVYNEADNIGPLAEEINDTLSAAAICFEIIFVDDASTDGSKVLLETMNSSRIRAVFHRINCGQSAAVASGFHAASGTWIATLDGDGQNDPADLPRMLERAISEKVDCVTGVRGQRQDNRIRKISSKVANGFRNLITGDQVSDSGCGIRVVCRDALKEIFIFNGMHRFLPTLLRAQGYKVIEHQVNHRERLQGVSKYGVSNRLWRGIRDCFGVRWYTRRAIVSRRVERFSQKTD